MSGKEVERLRLDLILELALHGIQRTTMTFIESNTVEQMLLNAVAKLGGKQASMVRKDALPSGGESLGDALRSARWTYASYDQVPL